MSILRWQPHPYLNRFQDEINRVFEDFFPRMWEGREPFQAMWKPTVDVAETEDEITVEADIPGMNKDDIQVSPENNTLTIKN